MSMFLIRILTIFFLVFFMFAGNIPGNHSKKSDSSNTNVQADSPNDSVQVWLNVDYLESLEKGVSICTCWKKTRYQLVYFDSVKMELFLKSNLMHFGHDSEFLLPVKKLGRKFLTDTLSYEWPIEMKEFEIIDVDTMVLSESGKDYRFIKTYFPKSSNSTKQNTTDYNGLVESLYAYNSRTLLAYKNLKKELSSTTLVSIDSLKNLIFSWKVSAHCSDDFFYDGMTILSDPMRHFELKFDESEVIMYENNGRGRYQKLNLDTLPKQVMKK